MDDARLNSPEVAPPPRINLSAKRERNRIRLTIVAALAILLPRMGSAQAAGYETLYSFKGSPDGAQPKGGVVIGSSGVLYGTTSAGGASVLGTVYALAHITGEGWQEKVLHSFSNSEGEYPQGTLTFGTNGTLYGTTISAGGGAGTIFEIAPPSIHGGSWTETVLYTYPHSRDSQSQVPNGGILIGQSGTIYTTTQGDTVAGGAVEALVPPAVEGGAWTEDVLYTFTVPSGASTPFAGLASENGSVFGTTVFNGDFSCGGGGCGAVYELMPGTSPNSEWTLTTLHDFEGAPNDGGGSTAALTVGPNGVLYGTTTFGGSGACATDGLDQMGCGTVFQLIPPTAPGGNWAESVIYSFTEVNGDGATPTSSVMVGQNGVLYGTTQNGGSDASQSVCPASYTVVGGCGTVYSLTPPTTPGGPWTETVLHEFSGENGDGANPVAGLALSSTGILYGTTSAGGASGKGTVFAIKP